MLTAVEMHVRASAYSHNDSKEILLNAQNENKRLWIHGVENYDTAHSNRQRRYTNVSKVASCVDLC